MSTWTNDDGLHIKYGTQEAQSTQQGGFICSYGPWSTLVLNLDLTLLTASEDIQNDVLVIPADSLIESVEFLAIVGATTGTAIDVGLINADRDTSSALTASVSSSDPNGIIEAYPTAAMATVGEHEHYWQTRSLGTSSGAGNATVGALVGEILTEPALITASRTDGTAFDAGKVQMRINFVPEATTGFGAVH